MKFVIQRVLSANVAVDGNVIGEIGKGYLVLVGISHSDDYKIADKMLKKLIGLRIFEDNAGKTNLDIKAVSGEILMVSQFTLYADCKKGNRPSFTRAGAPDYARELYEYLLKECRKEIPKTECGIFGADMKVKLINDGPFTILLNSDEICN